MCIPSRAHCAFISEVLKRTFAFCFGKENVYGKMKTIRIGRVLNGSTISITSTV